MRIAAPGVGKGGDRSERSGGRLEAQFDTEPASAHRTDWLKAIGVGLNAAERELAACRAAVEDAAVYGALFGLGIKGRAVNGRGPFDALAVEAVVFLPNRRFEFAKAMADATGYRLAIIVPARDEAGEVIDLAAWSPATGDVFVWHGRAGLLGAESVNEPRGSEPLAVFETVEDWLRADRRGVVILDYGRAAEALDGVTLEPRSVQHGQMLRAKLARPAPPLAIRRAAR